MSLGEGVAWSSSYMTLEKTPIRVDEEYNLFSFDII
jgi:hypothetical protein